MPTATTFRTRLLLPAAAAVLFALATGGAAFSADLSEAPSTVAAGAVVGRWLHDEQGNVVGSVRGLADGGRTAIVLRGSYFQPGVHEERVPARDLAIAADGTVTLRRTAAGHGGVAEALNAPPRRGGGP